MKKATKIFYPLAALLCVALLALTVSCDNGTTEVSQCKVTYQSDYGTAPAEAMVESGTVLTAAQLPELEAEGRTFCGWYDGETLAVAGKYKVTRDVTLVSKWDLNTYTVTFDANADGATVGMEEQTFTHVVSQPLAENTFTREGYVFIGWNTRPDGSGTTYADKAEFTATADATLYAMWGIAADNVANIINELGTSTEPHTVVVAGPITSDTISAIKSALNDNSGAKVNLDLSQTTGLDSLATKAFYSCTTLMGVVLPDSVMSIEDHAFRNCTNLTSVEIPDSVTNIGYSAFESCEKLTSVKIPYGVTSIGYYVFSGCSGLTSVDMPDSVTSIGGYVNRYTKSTVPKHPKIK